jgi:hypothetical protein
VSCCTKKVCESETQRWHVLCADSSLLCAVDGKNGAEPSAADQKMMAVIAQRIFDVFDRVSFAFPSQRAAVQLTQFCLFRW